MRRQPTATADTCFDLKHTLKTHWLIFTAVVAVLGRMRCKLVLVGCPKPWLHPSAVYGSCCIFITPAYEESSSDEELSYR